MVNTTNAVWPNASLTTSECVLRLRNWYWSPFTRLCQLCLDFTTREGNVLNTSVKAPFLCMQVPPTFRNPLVWFIPEPWISKGWKNTVSPFSISKCTLGWSGLWLRTPWYILFIPPWKETKKQTEAD